MSFSFSLSLSLFLSFLSFVCVSPCVSPSVKFLVRLARSLSLSLSRLVFPGGVSVNVWVRRCAGERRSFRSFVVRRVVLLL